MKNHNPWRRRSQLCAYDWAILGLLADQHAERDDGRVGISVDLRLVYTVFGKSKRMMVTLSQILRMMICSWSDIPFPSSCITFPSSGSHLPSSLISIRYVSFGIFTKDAVGLSHPTTSLTVFLMISKCCILIFMRLIIPSHLASMKGLESFPSGRDHALSIIVSTLPKSLASFISHISL